MVQQIGLLEARIARLAAQLPLPEGGAMRLGAMGYVDESVLAFMLQCRPRRFTIPPARQVVTQSVVPLGHARG